MFKIYCRYYPNNEGKFRQPWSWQQAYCARYLEDKTANRRNAAFSLFLLHYGLQQSVCLVVFDRLGVAKRTEHRGPQTGVDWIAQVFSYRLSGQQIFVIYIDPFIKERSTYFFPPASLTVQNSCVRLDNHSLITSALYPYTSLLFPKPEIQFLQSE